MLDILLFWGSGVLIILSCISVAVWAWFQFPKRTVDDILGFLRHVDMDIAYELVDPVAEGSLRSTMTAREFRSAQLKRVHLCMEQLKRMSHNSNVLLELAKRERSNQRPEVRECAGLVHETGVIVRVFCLIALLKLRFRLLVRIDTWAPFGSLTLCDIKETLGIRGIERYDQFKTAASYLFLLLQDSKFEELSAAL